MRFSTTPTPQDRGPLIQTRVLNVAECNVNLVGATSRHLVYTERRKLFSTATGISKVIFIQSQVHKGRISSAAVEADFDIYLEDGRVIEVNSCDKRVIEAAYKYAPQKNPRVRYREARGL